MNDKSFCIITETDENFGIMPNIPPKILVADDDEGLRTCIVELIKMEDWEVIEAIDGRDALNKIFSEKPTLLILDNRMPELTGAEAILELRRLEVQIPVVLITAAAEITTLADDLGIKCYLGKPFGIDELINIIRNAIKGNCY